MGARLKNLPATVLRWLYSSSGALWRAIRQLSGDDGYERYLAYHVAAHPDLPTLPRCAWFARQQRHKWAGIRRCC